MPQDFASIPTQERSNHSERWHTAYSTVQDEALHHRIAMNGRCSCGHSVGHQPNTVAAHVAIAVTDRLFREGLL